MIKNITNNDYRHPASLWYLSASYALLVFTYLTFNSLLVLYATHRLHMSLTQAYSLYGAFNALVFTSPLLGGLIAEKFTYKRTGLVGLLFAAASAFILSYPSTICYYLGLAVFTVGYGLCTPAMFCLVGLCYAREDPRRDSGYTLFYMLFNIGSFTGTVIGGYLAQVISYSSAFIIAGCIALIGALILVCSRHLIIQHPENNHVHPEFKFSKPVIYGLLVIIAIVFCPITVLLYKTPAMSEALLWALVVIASVGILVMAFRQCHRLARYKLIAFLILTALSGLFWALYMLESSVMTMFADHNLDRVILGFSIPPSVFFALDPLGVIVFGLILGWLWLYLGKRNKNPSLPSKFALAMIAMGLGYVVFGIATFFVNQRFQVSIAWIVFGYVFLTLGEMLLSPIGMSMVGRLSPAGKEGRLMGVWTLFTGFGAILSGYLANFTAAGIKVDEPRFTNVIYRHDFFLFGGSCAVIGLIFVLFIPFIKRLIHN